MVRLRAGDGASLGLVDCPCGCIVVPQRFGCAGILALADGTNAIILAFFQTGSGCTHLPCAVAVLFHRYFENVFFCIAAGAVPRFGADLDAGCRVINRPNGGKIMPECIRVSRFFVCADRASAVIHAAVQAGCRCARLPTAKFVRCRNLCNFGCGCTAAARAMARLGARGRASLGDIYSKGIAVAVPERFNGRAACFRAAALAALMERRACGCTGSLHAVRQRAPIMPQRRNRFCLCFAAGWACARARTRSCAGCRARYVPCTAAGVVVVDGDVVGFV